MNILRKSEYTAPPLQSKERELLRSDSDATQPDSPRQPVFSKETLVALDELGLVLRQIRRRMRDEGYAIVDGKVVKIATTQ